MVLGKFTKSVSGGLPRVLVDHLPLLAASFAAGLLLTCRPPVPEPEPAGTPSVSRPAYNLVIVSIDTLRADRLSLYGYDRPTSPTLNELSTEALVMDRFFSSGGGTLASHMSMLTSLPPEVHGIFRKGHRLAPERSTLAEALAAQGYRTAAITGGGYTSAVFGFGQGFEIYDDTGWGLERALPRAFTWLLADDDRPFFLFLHTYDVHSTLAGQPYDCPDGFANLYTGDYEGDFNGCVGERCASRLLVWLNENLQTNESYEISEHLSAADIDYLSSRYDGCINYVDNKLGEIVEHLRRRGLWDKTLFLVTSDHGEEFLDHGLLLHMQGGFDEMAHLPLILKLPDSELGGTRFQGFVSMIDLAPTILSALGIEPSDEMLGQDLLPAVLGRTPPREEVDFMGTVRSAEWKLIPKRDGDLLFDLAGDPGETQNVAPLHPDRAARLRARSDRIRAHYLELKKSLEADDAAALEATEPSAEQIERLRALGYLD